MASVLRGVDIATHRERGLNAHCREQGDADIKAGHITLNVPRIRQPRALCHGFKYVHDLGAANNLICRCIPKGQPHEF